MHDLNDDNNYRHIDPFGLSNIDKIQAEIERDLEKPDAKPPETSPWLDLPPLPDDFMYVDEPDGCFDEEEDIPITKELVAHASPPLYTAHTPTAFASPAMQTGSFYRETVKNVSPSRSDSFFGIWHKVAVFLLICTLGTGSLGFGLGFGVRFFASGELEPLRETANSYIGTFEIPTITTTQYVFETTTGNPDAGSIADIIEILEPSVVSISAYFDDSFLGGRPNQGSGIIFAENEERIFIVTNHYVVRGSQSVTVSISGSEPLDATPVGSEQSLDLNVISVDKAQLFDAGIDSIVIATFGDSSQMRVGDTVLAIGNAMGEGNSVTRGVISAPETEVTLHGRETPMLMLQTDAAINYGNSGGPLINTRGEVVGININQASNMIFGMTPVEGMGYSISSNAAIPILNRLINYRRPGLGITGGNVNYEIADRWGIPVLGVYVQSVIEGQSAYNAGLLPSDIITGFNGLPVFNFSQLVEAISNSEIGDIVEMRILRDGRDAITLTVELGVFVQVNF